MLRKITIYLGLIFFLKMAACTNGEPEIPATPLPASHQTIGVSVWDRISARTEPRRASASATLLSLGESFLYLDTFAIDSSYQNTKFLKARLSDSTEVWVYGFASVLNAKPAIISAEVPLYMRPDLLTITSSNMKAMEIVAVTEEWDNWIKVVNEKKERTGWIKKEFVSYTTMDIAFGLLVRRTLEEADQEKRIDNIEALLENNPYPNTIFISELRNRLDQEREEWRENEAYREREDREREEQDRRKRNR
jgi:hypothetical protein